MQRTDKKTPVFVTTGIALLFVVFISLCLVVFALLTFSTAKSEQSLSDKRVQGITEYYEACTRANNKVAEIDIKLRDMTASDKERGDGVISLEELQETFGNNSGILVSEINGDAYPELSFSETISDSKNLEVKLILTDASYGDLSKCTASHYYTVKSWQTVVTSDWTGNDTLTLSDTKGE